VTLNDGTAVRKTNDAILRRHSRCLQNHSASFYTAEKQCEYERPQNEAERQSRQPSNGHGVGGGCYRYCSNRNRKQEVRDSANRQANQMQTMLEQAHETPFRSESCLRALKLIDPQHKHADLQRSSILSMTPEPQFPASRTISLRPVAPVLCYRSSSRYL
jgi:hypothetical protein